jgi:hypothetical protein
VGNLKREELNKVSPAVGENVLKFIETFEQYIGEIRADSTKEEIVELLPTRSPIL